MNKRKIISGVISIALLWQPIGLSNAYAETQLLKEGSRGRGVQELQIKLKELGYFNFTPTGYYGKITKNAVLSLQRDLGLTADGIVGNNTYKTISNKLEIKPVSRGLTRNTSITYWGWFDKIKDVIPRGAVYKITDIQTGKSFNAKRTYGTNHADTETLTAEDTYIMKEIYNNAWSWARRPIIVEMGGYVLPASMAGMPHAGIEDKPAGQTVSARSGGYGTGYNFDLIKGNNMDGHFDVHFFNSRTHGTNRVDPAHQKAIATAREYIENELNVK